MTRMMPTIGRRPLITGLAGGAAAASLGAKAFAAPTGRTLKIGLVAPQTGELAFFYTEVPFVMEQINKYLGDHIVIKGVSYPYQIIVRDSQSNPNRASQVAQDLIFNEKVDIMTTFATPETVNPVSDQCEANGMPCVSTDCPLESYYFGRGAPKNGFQWTYNFFFSFHRQAIALTDEWSKIPSNKVIGVLWPNDADGQGASKMYPPILKAKGYKIVDPGRFDMPSNYAAQIAMFKSANVEVVNGVLPPPQFVAFWNAAAQQGFKPRILTVGKGTEFSQPLIPLGKRAYNISVEIWWTPAAPFVSGLTGITSRGLADTYEKATGRQWSMTLGIRHALFETAFEALRTAENLNKPASIRDAIRDMKYKSIAGPIDFKTGPFPNTSITPLVVGQWRKGTKYPLDLLVVDNTLEPDIPVQSKPEPVSYS